PSPRWAIAARGGSLLVRIRRIVARPTPPANGHLAAVAILGLLVFVGALTTQLRVPASADDKQASSPAVAANPAAAPEPAQANDRDRDNQPAQRIAGQVVDVDGKPVALARLWWRLA